MLLLPQVGHKGPLVISMENECPESAEELLNAPTFSNVCWDQDKYNVFCPLGKN